MAISMGDFPRGTPVFGRCIGCSNALPYPPIQIPVSVCPGEIKGKYDIGFEHYCLVCAAKRIKRLKEKDITPTQCWAIGALDIIDNPYRSK